MEVQIDVEALEARFEATRDMIALITLAVVVSQALVELQAVVIASQRDAVREPSSDSVVPVLADVEGHMATIERLRRLHRALHDRILENA